MKRLTREASVADELFRTVVAIPQAPFLIEPAEQVLCVGSCFAEAIGRRLADDHFPTMVNPHGVMYNPASVVHSIDRITESMPKLRNNDNQNVISTAILTFGTNHVYIEKATGEIVDNCQKRPQNMFQERELSVEECAGYMLHGIETLRKLNPLMKIILTVSPIRYRKYGYHESQISKATLLLAADFILRSQVDKESRSQEVEVSRSPTLSYFPAYELLLDELRDYRFYAKDMLHPSEQAADYIYRRFQETFFSKEAMHYVAEWQPIREALSHRPFNAEAPEYQEFAARVQAQRQAFEEKWNPKSV